MNCVMCGVRIGEWRAPGEKGTEQGWKRPYIVDGKGRARCADRTSCRSRANGQ